MLASECAKLLSHVRLFATPWTVAHQVPLSMEFSRQEYWSGLPFPTPRDLPDLGIEPMSPVSPALADRFFTTEPLRKPIYIHTEVSVYSIISNYSDSYSVLRRHSFVTL